MDATGTTVDTRTRILLAAERLFAERGIHGASLREVNRAAGQSNTGAVQYYFGDRRGLVRAVLARHRREDEARRHVLLDEYEAAGVVDLRSLAAAMVLPLALKLDDEDGRRYLQISAEYYLNASRAEVVATRIPDASMDRWHRLLDDLAGEQAWADELLRLTPRGSAVRLTLLELARLAAAEPHPGDQLFVSYLVDLVTSMLETGMSAQTLRLRRNLAEQSIDGLNH